MRNVAVISAFALAITLGGCSGEVVPSEEGTASPSEEPSSDEQTPSEEPTPSVEPSAAPVVAPIVTTIPPEVMLPGDAFGADESIPSETIESVDMWKLPEGCTSFAPTAAMAARTVAYGDGMYESRIGRQQLAVFADADVATAEAQRLHDAAVACAAATDQTQVYVVEDVAVGAQGTGVAYDYYGQSAEGRTLDEAQGYYVVVTRRGNAVTIVGYYEGEDNLGSSRENAVTTSQAAWELLCVYDSAGC